MKLTAYTVNAFAKTAEGGNPAGIVLNADSLSESQMKEIAAQIGFSETAFVMKSSVADMKVRFFTPTDEVDLCGHATIGTFSFMKERSLLSPGEYTQETKAGLLNLTITEQGTIMMEQAPPQFGEFVDSKLIAQSLQISPDDLHSFLLPQIVSTGLRDIMIPVKNMHLLDSIRPDFNLVEKVSKQYHVVGYHMFSLDTLYQDTAYCRNLAPLYGIPEESATGTSNGALACYLSKYMQFEESDLKHLVFEQGYYMKKPSEIQVSLTMQNNQIQQVRVGGIARNIQEIQIEF